jgi:hypothetical protein
MATKSKSPPARSANAKANAVADRAASRFGTGNAKKLKGYADGGKVDSDKDYPGHQVPSKYEDPTAYNPKFMPPEIAAQFNAPDEKGGYQQGGKIKHTSGKPVGKDDGMIPAKRGEYVVKKSSTAKYGPAKMAAVNKGTAKVTKGKK